MRPSKVKRIVKAKAKPDRRPLGLKDLQIRLELLERAHDRLRDRVDKAESLLGDMLDGTATMQVDRAVSIDQRYLNGRWIKQDGTVYAPLKPENGDDKGSGKPPQDGGRALRKRSQVASQGRR